MRHAEAGEDEATEDINDAETASTLRESAKNTKRVLEATRRFRPKPGTGKNRYKVVVADHLVIEAEIMYYYFIFLAQGC